MTQRTRKFIGVFLLLGLLVGWSVLATAIYLLVLPNAPAWLLIPYFAVAGIGWFFPAAWAIRWMVRP